MNIFAQERSDDREPVAAGRFYPAGKEILNRDLSILFATCEKPKEKMKVRAIISPHAGYVFSGKAAAAAFSSIPKDAKYKNIFLIGSSHVMAFDGASVYDAGDFVTPLGKAKVNRDIASKLRNSNPVFNHPLTSHINEHSLEVQIPFIQYYFKEAPELIPIVIGTNNKKSIKSIAEMLRPWFTDDNLFIISSDFSHYPSYKDACETDRLTADAIVSKNPDNFLSVLSKNSSASIPGLATSMCGWTSGLVLLYLAENNTELEFKKVYYCNSGDSNYGDKNEVVGYNSIVLVEKFKGSSNPGSGNYEVSFSKSESEMLFSIARKTIDRMLDGKRMEPIDPNSVPGSLKRKMGAFVTIKINGSLRGCIGRFTPEEPLYEVVSQMAAASAFNDTRFSPLTREEYSKADIEISVLGPLRKIESISEITLGKHGIYIKKDYRSGTMLPQVATENNWTLEQFLGYTSRDKAGLDWTGWKDADIYIYEAVVLEEKR